MSAPIAHPLLRVSLFIVTLLIGSILLAVLGALLMYRLLGEDFYLKLGQAEYLPLVVLLYLLQWLLYLGLVWLFCRYVDQRPVRHLGLDEATPLTWLAKGAALGALLAVLAFLSSWALGGVTVERIQLPGDSLFWFGLLFAMVALGEELVFRGYIFYNLRQRLGDHGVVLGSSLLFTLMHLGNEHLALLALVNILLAGLLLGVLRLYRGGLWLAMGLHFAWNYIQGPVLGYAVSGIAVEGVLQLKPQGAAWLSGGAFGLEGSVLASLLMLTALFILYPWKKTQ